jgi:hypothetical protein
LRQTDKEILDIKFVLIAKQDRAERARAEKLGREVLARYRVLEDDDWRARPLVSSLDELLC